MLRCFHVDIKQRRLLSHSEFVFDVPCSPCAPSAAREAAYACAEQAEAAMASCGAAGSDAAALAALEAMQRFALRTLLPVAPDSGLHAFSWLDASVAALCPALRGSGGHI